MLCDIQTPTNKINENALDLVRRLRLPVYVLANTFARRVALEMRGNADEHEKNLIEPADESHEHAKWLRL